MSDVVIVKLEKGGYLVAKRRGISSTHPVYEPVSKHEFLTEAETAAQLHDGVY